MDEPQPTGRIRRRDGVAGVRLVGIFVPWQAVVATLVMVAALGGLVAGRMGGGRSEIHLASSDDETTTTSSAPAAEAPVVPSTSTTVSPSSTTTTVETNTTTTKPPVKTAGPTAGTVVTTTTVSPPATCAVIPSTVSGSVTSAWQPSATSGVWERHTTVTVKNPTTMPVVLGYTSTWSTATAYVFTIAGTDGRRLEPDESVTATDVYTYAGDHTVRGYSPPPDALYSVEFSPVSAPQLFCRTRADRPFETEGAPRHPTEPKIYVLSEENMPSSGPLRVRFTSQGLFTGVRVHYRMLMAEGALRNFTADLGPDFQGSFTTGNATHPFAELASGDGPPRFQGITGVEWNGTMRPCAEATVNGGCAPADGSPLQTFPH